MASRPKNLDPNQLAKRILDEATGDEPKTDPHPPLEPKLEGRRSGGLKGGPARAERLSPDQRSEIAKRAAAARWKK